MGSVEDQEYYHGVIPREDLKELFEEGGDYLVRMTRKDKESPFVISVSLCSNKSKIKHFIVTPSDRGFTVDNVNFFPDVVKLVNFYSSKKIGLNGTDDTVLKRPVSRAKWELSHDQVTLEKTLGQGVSGCVKQGTLTLPGRKPIKVAVKMRKKDDVNVAEIKNMMKEGRIMRNFVHPHIVRTYGVVLDKEPYLIVMELLPLGDLKSYLPSHPSTAKKKVKWSSEAAYGLEYLHFKHFIHRDIAARNCFLSSAEMLKIGDFGLTREGEKYRMETRRKVPIKWIPPEVIQNNTFSLKSDVWSYGILVWEIMANGQTPYNALPNAKVKEMILEGKKNDFPADADREVAKFVETKCWVMDPSERCTMQEAAEVMSRLSGTTNPSQAGSGESTELVRTSRSKTYRASKMHQRERRSRSKSKA